MKNYPITIETGEHAGETVWVHRSIAVAGFIFCRINNEWCVLANQRGEGAPDFQGYWNCPCGYLDFDETLAEALGKSTRKLELRLNLVLFICVALTMTRKTLTDRMSL